MAKVIERVEAHYEVQEVEMGTVYRWCPESVVVKCGERFHVAVSGTTCDVCSEDHRSIAQSVGPPLEG